MSQTHTCSFRSIYNRECLHHLRPEFPIRFSPKLGMYLCAQHEKMIIEDHMTQFYDAQIRHKNMPDGAILPTYNTFSTQIFNRFLDRQEIQYLPIELPINQSLYSFYIEWSIFDTENVDCNMFIKNNENLIQLSSHHDAEIRKFFRYSTMLFTEEELTYYNMNIFFTNINMNTRVFDINIPADIFRQRMDELLLQLQIERGQNDYDSDEEINRHLQSEGFIDRVPSPVRIFDDDDGDEEEEIQITRPVRRIIFDDNEEEDEIQITRPVRQKVTDILELTMIDFCNICLLEERQKGYQMSCCNRDNKVCVSCVINHQLIEFTKYCSFLDIKNMNMFSTEKQPCFFCRHSNSVEKIKDDNECKEKFVQLLQIHIQQELKEKELKNIERIRRTIGL